MLTRGILEQRLRRVAGLIELFGNRKTTTPPDRTWATDALATLAAIPVDGPSRAAADTQSDALTPTMRDTGNARIAKPGAERPDAMGTAPRGNGNQVLPIESLQTARQRRARAVNE